MTKSDVDTGLEGFPIVSGEDSEEGPWINRLPEELVRSLAALPDDDVTRTATAWADSQELEGWEVDELERRLRAMRGLAQTSLAAGKSIHLWTCL